MSLIRAGFKPSVIAIVTVAAAGCAGGDPSPAEATDVNQAAWAINPNAGFMPFGGLDGLCLGVANDRPAAGAKLVSVTCSRVDPQQGWKLSGPQSAWSPTQSISPQQYPSLCVDIGPTTDFVHYNGPLLQPCNGTSGQQWRLEGGQIEVPPFQSFLAVGCIGVHGGSTASGTPLDVTTCNGSAAQTFWAWGFPMSLETFNGLGATNPTFGQVLQTTALAPWGGTQIPVSSMPSADVFYGTYDRQIVQYNWGVVNWKNCLDSESTLTMQPCAYPTPATQQWHPRLATDGTGSGYYYEALANDARPRIVPRGWTGFCLEMDGLGSTPTMSKCGSTLAQLMSPVLGPN